MSDLFKHRLLELVTPMPMMSAKVIVLDGAKMEQWLMPSFLSYVLLQFKNQGGKVVVSYRPDGLDERLPKSEVGEDPDADYTAVMTRIKTPDYMVKMLLRMHIDSIIPLSFEDAVDAGFSPKYHKHWGCEGTQVLLMVDGSRPSVDRVEGRGYAWEYHYDKSFAGQSCVALCDFLGFDQCAMYMQYCKDWKGELDSCEIDPKYFATSEFPDCLLAHKSFLG